ncbi:lipase [Bacteroidia bacterium]|nr:lipase [Bacteroidia bacterium]GHT83139.1 lipase [Bacteroidia bacterium]
MKKYFFASLISLFSGSAYLCAQNLTDAANFERYVKANQVVPNRVVFIGNSITDIWFDAHPEFFTSNGFIGRGIGGQTSSQLLLRFRQDVINLHPQAVVINIGTNDIAENTGTYSPALTLDCIHSMAELAHANGIKVILSSVTPAKEYPWRKEIKDVVAKIDALNAKIKALAASHHFAYLDYNTPMRDASGGMIKEYTTDGVHVSNAGYAVMENLAKETIGKLLGIEYNK